MFFGRNDAKAELQYFGHLMRRVDSLENNIVLEVLDERKRNVTQQQYAAAAKSLQSCPTLCDPIDGSPPGSPVHGILQSRTLEWVAISFSNA